MVTIFAELVAKPDTIELVAEKVREIIPITQAEPGCIEYRIAQGVENRECFYGYEVFDSPESFQAHLASEHFTQLVTSLEGALAQEPKITMTEQL